MKVTKTSVHRLTIEKTCGCHATREYEDVRYTKPLSEGVFAACEKHEKNKLVAEFAGEMLIEALDKEAESAGKAPQVTHRAETATALSGTLGENVTSMGAPNLPKTRDKRDPLAAKNARFERPDMRKPQNPHGNLNVAQEDISDEEITGAGITMDGNIDEVPEDPRATAAMQGELANLDTIFDEDDSREGGVSKKLVDLYAAD